MYENPMMLLGALLALAVLFILAPLTLHMFVVFFAVISAVTPPVALAAFAAAPIAGASPLITGLQAARLSVAGFIIPFVFVYHPAALYKLQTLFVWFGEDLPRSKAMVDLTAVTWLDLSWVFIAFVVAMLFRKGFAAASYFRRNHSVFFEHDDRLRPVYRRRRR